MPTAVIERPIPHTQVACVNQTPSVAVNFVIRPNQHRNNQISFLWTPGKSLVELTYLPGSGLRFAFRENGLPETHYGEQFERYKPVEWIKDYARAGAIRLPSAVSPYGSLEQLAAEIRLRHSRELTRVCSSKVTHLPARKGVVWREARHVLARAKCSQGQALPLWAADAVPHCTQCSAEKSRRYAPLARMMENHPARLRRG